MLGTRGVQHADLVYLQSYVSTTGHTRTDMVFEFVDETDSIFQILTVAFLR
jgi:hypothetical protein